MRPIVFLLFTAFLSTGCTFAKASYHLVDAELTVIRARDYGAEEHAVYEYTMANRYLEKAREEAGYSEYKTAWELANTASEWADQAVISIDERGLGPVPSEISSDMNGGQTLSTKPQNEGAH